MWPEVRRNASLFVGKSLCYREGGGKKGRRGTGSGWKILIVHTPGEILSTSAVLSHSPLTTIVICCLIPMPHLSDLGTRLGLMTSCYGFFTGYMLGNLPLEKSGIVSKEHICEGECIS